MASFSTKRALDKALLLALLVGSSQAQYELAGSAFGTGGFSHDGDRYTLTTLLGEIALTEMRSGSYVLRAGFCSTYYQDLASWTTLLVPPLQFQLRQNYPNPFTELTHVQFALPIACPVTLEVYDVLGRKVGTLLAGRPFPKGRFEILWEGKDEAGFTVPSGHYFCRMHAGLWMKTVKITITR